jgi:hypothetical protein
VTGKMLHTGDPQKSGANKQNIGALVTWHLGYVQSCGTDYREFSHLHIFKHGHSPPPPFLSSDLSIHANELKQILLLLRTFNCS